jgi:hypothetical protein
MKLIIDKPKVRQLPSRRRFALARLIALVTFRFPARTTPGVDRVIYAIDRDHDQVENFFVSLWFAVTAIAYTAALLPFRQSAAAALVAVAIAPFALAFLMFSAGLFTRYGDGDYRRYQSIYHMAVLLALSLHFARSQSLVRYVAWCFLAICAVNAIAAAIMLFARGTVARMEAECGL